MPKVEYTPKYSVIKDSSEGNDRHTLYGHLNGHCFHSHFIKIIQINSLWFKSTMEQQGIDGTRHFDWYKLVLPSVRQGKSAYQWYLYSLFPVAPLTVIAN